MMEIEVKSWSKAFRLAQKLEHSEPDLVGFSSQILAIKESRSFSYLWLNKLSHGVDKENILRVAFELNFVARHKFVTQELETAKAICQFSAAIYKAILGESHPDTIKMIKNLKRVEAATRPLVA